MSRFIEGQSRTQSTLFPEVLDDYIHEDNPIRAVDMFINSLDLSDLGFTKEAKANAINAAKRHAGTRKEKTGFIAGMYIKGERNAPTS